MIMVQLAQLKLQHVMTALARHCAVESMRRWVSETYNMLISNSHMLWVLLNAWYWHCNMCWLHWYCSQLGYWWFVGCGHVEYLWVQTYFFQIIPTQISFTDSAWNWFCKRPSRYCKNLYHIVNYYQILKL